VEVAQAGLYEVELWYACPKKDLGANVELSFLGQSLTSTISREVNPPLLTGFDRKQRVEGYVKYFEPMKMGKIRLTQGKGELKLQAKKIPGDQALEFRLLMINRIEKKKS
jgi:hypothetical protein